MDFELLASKHAKVQKAHLELKQKKQQIKKAQEPLHIDVQRVYQDITGEDIEEVMEEKFRKIDDTISQMQAQVYDLQMKIKPVTPLEERER